MLVQAFVAEPAVEALDEGVLDQLSRRDVVLLDPGRLAEAQDGVADEFGAVVAVDHEGLSPPSRQRFQLAHDPCARQRRVDHAGETFPREVVDHVQHPEAATVVECIGDEVERPTLVRPLWDRRRRSRAQSPFPSAAPAHHQPFFLVEPIDALQIDRPTFPPQQDRQTPIAEASPLVRKLAQPGSDGGIVAAAPLVLEARSIHAEKPAGSSLRQSVTGDRPPYGI